MLALYLFAFSPEEAHNLAAYERYMGTYWIAVVAALLLAGPAGEKPAKRTAAPAWALCTLVALAVAAPPPAWYEAFVPHTRPDAQFAPYAGAARRLGQAADIGVDKVYIVDQATGNPGYLTIAFRYYGSPLRTNRGGTNVGGARGVPAAEWARTLAGEGYTLVYLHRLAGDGGADFNALFSGEGPAEGGLYRVEPAGGGIRLVRQAAIE
jgi:hypothetical protein